MCDKMLGDYDSAAIANRFLGREVITLNSVVGEGLGRNWCGWPRFGDRATHVI